MIDRNTPEYAAIVAILDDGEMAMRRPDSQETADLIVSALRVLSEATPDPADPTLPEEYDETSPDDITPDPALDVDVLRCGNCGDDLLPSEVRGHLFAEGRTMGDELDTGLDRTVVRKLLGEHHRLLQTTARNCALCWNNRAALSASQTPEPSE